MAEKCHSADRRDILMKQKDRSVSGQATRIRYTLGAKLFIGGLYFGALFLVVLLIYMMKNPY